MFFLPTCQQDLNLTQAHTQSDIHNMFPLFCECWSLQQGRGISFSRISRLQQKKITILLLFGHSTSRSSSILYRSTMRRSCFQSFCLSTKGGGGEVSRQMHNLAHVQGIENFLAKKCSWPEEGSGYMQYLANVPGIEHFLAKKCSCPEGGEGRANALFGYCPRD